MKFAAAALIGLVSVSAIKIQKPPKGEEMPSAEEVIAHCDKNDDARLSKEEGWNCIKPHLPKDIDMGEAQEFFNGMYDAANFGEDGADAAELQAVFEAEEKHERGPKALAAVFKRHHHKALAQKGKKGGDDEMPSAAEVVAMCDQNDDARLSKQEGWECIQPHLPADIDMEEAQAFFSEMYDAANFGEDGADAAELEALFEEEEKHERGPKPATALAQAFKRHHHGLAQKGKKGDKMPTAAEVVAMCDKNDDARLSKEEGWNCIKPHLPADVDMEEAQEFFNHMYDAANFGEDGADAEELQAVFEAEEKHERGPPKSLAQRKHRHH
jgi:hypothetical protein